MNKTKICQILALFASLAAISVDGKPEPRGRKRAFGVGLLGGALAGGVIGNAMARHSMARPAATAQPQPQPPARHVTVIETSPPLSNGCYKQTIKEPLAHNPHAYVETVNLICPTVTPPPLPPAVLPPAQPPIPTSAAPPSIGWLSTNASEAVPIMPQPAPFYPSPLPTQQEQQQQQQQQQLLNLTQPVLQPPPAHQLQLQPQPPPVPAPPPQPALVPTPAPAPVTPQVIVLSKKAIYYDKKSRRNDANPLCCVSLLLTALTTLIAIKM